MPGQSPLTLSLSRMRYDITMPLFEGRVPIEGVEFAPKSNSPMVFSDMPELRQGDFGLWDLNCGYLLPAIEAGWEFVTLPLFIKRKSVLQFIFVRSDIKSPADLAGKKVASRQYRTSVTIWARGLMQEYYGVDTKSLRWLVQTPEFFPNHDSAAKIEMIDPKASLADMLIAGEIDCLITDISDGPLWRRLESLPSVRRLIPDYRTEDLRLHREHGIFPPMHVMVMSKKLDRDHPGLARKVYDAFEQAKTLAYQDVVNDRGGLTLVDLRERFFDQQDQWGDPWVYGVAANRRMMDTYIRYNRVQGAIKSDLSYERIFAAGTLET
jgi:4,5-dihydroxyphthalate decarboxylase